MTKNIQPWKKISSKTLLDHAKLKITEDVVCLPNNKRTKYVRHGAAQTASVIIIAVDQQKRILIQREYSYPPNKIMWQLPGGSVRAGEDVRAAAVRELAEESNLSAKKTKHIGSFYVHNRLSDMQQHIIVCTELFAHSLPADNDEFIETHWMTRQRISKMITSGEFDNINLLAALNVWSHTERG